MSLSADSGLGDGFAVEDVTTGPHASGFGTVGDGRTFAFRVLDVQDLRVEIYRPRLSGPVPQREDVVAAATRSCRGLDLNDERSLIAAVRDAVTEAATR
ncbi:hypothetical protein [[Mycobacterium] wendilense]|uniref:Uncharacterized protein n=1 Tax=[Mycobacterium] wendilense TaxID=3064284 RepID=A0ABM9MD31_9MYCO|nr:hypothetical protein [Mycolicibacterium sp. MU0050]CAJ1582282.1 hypothetical protein MU0050_002003 [Mycolicibacterium sp. MU0050]